MGRPPERLSKLAASFAVWIGSRWIRRHMPVATRIVLLASAAAVNAMNGSMVCQYCWGSSPPAGHGVFRLVGVWECSATHRDSEPSCSAEGASAVIEIAYSVGKIAAAHFTLSGQS